MQANRVSAGQSASANDNFETQPELADLRTVAGLSTLKFAYD